MGNRIKVDNFDSFDSFDQSGTAGEWERVTVVRENGWVKADLLTECKSWKTAVRRFFKAMSSDPAFDGWEECIRESCENGHWKDSSTVWNCEKGRSEFVPGYAWEVVQTSENAWYIFLNVYTGAETTDTTTDAQSADDMKGANTMNTTTNATETTTNAARMFPRLTAEIEADAANRVYSVEHFINYGFRPSWGKQHQTDPDRGLRAWLTPRRWEQYQGGEIDRARAVELATHRAVKAENKETARNLARLEAAVAAPGFDSVSVSVTWARSRTWGANPTAEVVNIGDRKTTGHASGCGYDKESAAIAEALNQNPAALRVLYDLAENALSAGKSPMTCTGYDWRDSIGYGSGYGVLPYFEGGVGSDCFWSIFKSAGYTVKHAGSGKMFDCWTLSK